MQILYITDLQKLPGKKAGSLECSFFQPKMHYNSPLRTSDISKSFPGLYPDPRKKGRGKKREGSRKGLAGDEGMVISPDFETW